MSESTVVEFAELPIGAAFRMLVGVQPMRKLTDRTAARIGSRIDICGADFVGPERCVRLPQYDKSVDELRAIYHVTDNQRK